MYSVRFEEECKKLKKLYKKLAEKYHKQGIELGKLSDNPQTHKVEELMQTLYRQEQDFDQEIKRLKESLD